MFEFSQRPQPQTMQQTPTSQTAINPTISSIQAIKTQMQALKQSSNPTAMLNNMLMTNPQFKEAANLINNTYKGDGKAAFYDAARAKGMNDQQIEEFIKALQ